MAIIEVNLVSGYIPQKEDLKRIVGYGTGFFKRYEVDGNLVTIYVDEFSSEELCFTFKIIREVDVENPKPGFVKVYDYYKPEYFTTMVSCLILAWTHSIPNSKIGHHNDLKIPT